MGKTVFHVDDDTDIQTAVKMILEKDGHAVTSFTDMQGCVDAALSQQPDVMLLDVMVEHLESGLEAYDKLKDAMPATKLVFLTSLGEMITPHFEDADHMPHILEKPIDHKALLKVVTEA